MENDSLTRYFFIGLLLALAYVTFLMTRPFLTYIFMAVILTYLMHPLYRKINTKMNRGLASGLMIIIALLLIIIPSFFIIKSLIGQATSAIDAVKSGALESLVGAASDVGIDETRLGAGTRELLNKLGDFIVTSASDFLSSLPQIFIGFTVLFFVMYYGFKDGEEFYRSVEKKLPLKKNHKDKLISEIHSVSHAVLYGQVLTAIIQGAVGALGFVIFGISNPIFWGFIMIILSFLPVVGTPIVWIPAGLHQIFMADNYVSGIGILIYGSILIANIDNVVRPKLISDKAKIHPVVILIGVLGGLYVFGFAGIVLGPLVVALLITMLKFYFEEKTFNV